jgi:GGDEF domain-containing protein
MSSQTQASTGRRLAKRWRPSFRSRHSLIRRIETEFALVLSEARIIKDKASEVLKF